MTENEIIQELAKVLEATPDNNQNGGLTVKQLVKLLPGYGVARVQAAIKVLEDNGIIEHVSYLGLNIAKRRYWGDAYRLVKK